MKSFKDWTNESFSSENDKSHYTHLEDELILHGSKAIPKIMTTIVELVKGIPTTQADTKIDGSPSIFYGYREGKFFVATKSIFNATPKINFTDKDIVENHGHAPGLVAKLKLGLTYLPSITPKTDHLTLQGDCMFAPSDLHKEDIDGVEHYLFQPNTVVNAIPVDSELGRQITASKFGFAPHTKYDENGRRIQISKSDVIASVSVFRMPVDAPQLSDIGSLQKDINEIRNELEHCSRPGLALMMASDVEPLFMTYKNATVRTGEDTSVDGFIKYVSDKLQKEIDRVKTEKTKVVKQASKDALLAKLNDGKDGLSSVIKTHSLVEKLKDKIISELDKLQPIRRYFRGEMGQLNRTNPEGYVTYNKFGTSKQVNRAVFSRQNFLAGSMRKEPVNESLKAHEGKTAVIVPLARFNPPHKDHALLIDATLKAANEVHGAPIIFVSLTQNNKKDPLNANEKIFYLNKMYPGHKELFQKPPASSPGLIGALKSLDGKFDNVVLVLGDDRASDVKPKVELYNGKEYNFKNIEVLSRHDITNTRNANGDDGVHASDIRRWAKEDDFDNVRASMSPKLSDTDVRRIMDTIKTRIK